MSMLINVFLDIPNRLVQAEKEEELARFSVVILNGGNTWTTETRREQRMIKAHLFVALFMLTYCQKLAT